VIGVDVNPQKVEIINRGRSPVIEQDLDGIIAEVVKAGRLRVTTSASEGVLGSDVSLICVGTPGNHNGSLDLTFVERVVHDIGRALTKKKDFHTVVLRSTVLPGTTQAIVIPALERSSGRVAGRDVGVCFNPEFLREGTSVNDFLHPPYTIIGQYDSRAAEVTSSLYGHLDAPVLTVPLRSAEMVKYANNAFHAVKIAFANEIGNICKSQGIDSRRVMDILCLDTQLNLSPYYLKPGFAFGGPCLPKDLRALLYHSHSQDLSLPVLEALLPSNELQIRRSFKMVKDTGRKKAGVLGISFKAGTDDLRESPMVLLIEMLIGKGFEVKIYDKNVSLARLHGSNRTYIEREIPHIATLMRDSMDEVVNESEVIVIGNNSPEYRQVLQHVRSDQVIIDLVSMARDLTLTDVRVEGICW
jgi:GDP-mannose 6-dehydrogenase